MREALKKVIPTSVLERRKQYILSRLRRRSVQSLSVSQAGQDFWVYAEAFNLMTGGYFVDVGAHDGVFLSNTYILESRYGWRGVCVEANPRTFRDLRLNRKCLCSNVCVDSSSGMVEFALTGTVGGIIADDTDNQGFFDPDSTVTVQAVKLSDLLVQSRSPRIVDYLTMDIEGAEERALLGFPFEDYVFRVVTIERPSAKLRDKLTQSGYLLVKEIPGLDCFYVHSSFREQYLRNCYAFYAARRRVHRVLASDASVKQI